MPIKKNAPKWAFLPSFEGQKNFLALCSGHWGNSPPASSASGPPPIPDGWTTPDGLMDGMEPPRTTDTPRDKQTLPGSYIFLPTLGGSLALFPKPVNHHHNQYFLKTSQSLTSPQGGGSATRKFKEKLTTNMKKRPMIFLAPSAPGHLSGCFLPTLPPPTAGRGGGPGQNPVSQSENISHPSRWSASDSGPGWMDTPWTDGHPRTDGLPLDEHTPPPGWTDGPHPRTPLHGHPPGGGGSFGGGSVHPK